ncbi:MAG: Threonine dehydratase, partial [uncultured Solirubrobacteraceae bacterium]
GRPGHDRRRPRRRDRHRRRRGAHADGAEPRHERAARRTGHAQARAVAALRLVQASRRRHQAALPRPGRARGRGRR